MREPATHPSPLLRIIYSSEVVAVGEFTAICICLWRGEVTATPFEHQRLGLAEVIANHPSGAGFMCVVEPTSIPPNDALRRASTEMVASHGDRLKCVACAIEGSGFRAAVARSALTGMALLFANRKVPISFFANVPDAAAWMSDRLPSGPLAPVIAAVAELRSSLPRRI